MNKENVLKEGPRIAHIDALKSIPVEETKINWELVEKIKQAKLKQHERNILK